MPFKSVFILHHHHAKHRYNPHRCEKIKNTTSYLSVGLLSQAVFVTYLLLILTTTFTYIHNYSANSLFSLERNECAKYLGVLIDSKLSWTHHIKYISTKISKSLGTLARLRHFVPSSTLLNIYRSLVQPYLSYGIAVWGQAAPTNFGNKN